ncbi:MAG: AraC family transcriptional regulator [Oceanococcaceae bacterium]
MSRTDIASTHGQKARRHSVAVHFVRLLTDYCAQRGLAAETLLESEGLPSNALDNPNHRLPFVAFDRMLCTAAEQLGDPHLGLHLGETARIGHLGISGLLQTACRNGWEVMPRLMRFSSLTMTAFRDEFMVEEDRATLFWRCELPAHTPSSHHQAELNFSHSITLAAQLTGVEAHPLCVQFRHAPPKDLAAVEAFFGCPVHWDAEVDSLCFPTSLLDRPINLGADTSSLQALEALCAQQLQDIQAQSDPEWLRAARSAIVDSLPEGQVLLAQVAPSTGHSARQLQKLLAERGLSFRQLVDEIRMELAERYLSNTELSLVEIAIRLGFQRAYRRWSDRSPGQARRSQSPTHSA